MMIDAEMYGMMLRCKDRHAPDRATGKHVEHAEDAALLLAKNVRQRLRVDARDRNICPESIDQQAPSVNQIRFLSSVAFEKAEKFRLETSCSAAEAMVNVLLKIGTRSEAPMTCSAQGVRSPSSSSWQTVFGPTIWPASDRRGSCCFAGSLSMLL